MTTNKMKAEKKFPNRKLAIIWIEAQQQRQQLKQKQQNKNALENFCTNNDSTMNLWRSEGKNPNE